MTSARRPDRKGFRWATGVLAVAIAGLLVAGLLHRSSAPTVLARYSAGYAAFLALLLLSLLTCLWALRRAPPRLVEVLTNTYLVAGSLVLSILLLEVALRVFNPWGMDFFHWLPYHMQGMVGDPELGYRHPASVSYHLGKNRVTLDSHGLRGKEIPFEKPVGEKRILLLGDSVTFGWGVGDGETFADAMGPLLASATGRRWEVINAGVNGYNTQQEEAYLRTEGIRFDPDLVILTYVSNDTDPIINPIETTWRRYPAWPGSLPEALDRLTALSYTYQATRMFLRARVLQARRSGEVRDEGGRVTAAAGWPASKDFLRRIAELCAKRNIHFLVASFTIGDPAFYSELEALGIQMVRLDEAFRKVPPADHYVSAVDPHPTRSVHGAIAEVLVREAARLGYLQ